MVTQQVLEIGFLKETRFLGVGRKPLQFLNSLPPGKNLEQPERDRNHPKGK
jgi:hypothetical protein